MKFRSDSHFKGEKVFTMNGTAPYLDNVVVENGVYVFAPLAIYIAGARRQIAAENIVPLPSGSILDSIHCYERHAEVQ